MKINGCCVGYLSHIYSCVYSCLYSIEHLLRKASITCKQKAEMFGLSALYWLCRTLFCPLKIKVLVYVMGILFLVRLFFLTFDNAVWHRKTSDSSARWRVILKQSRMSSSSWMAMPHYKCVLREWRSKEWKRRLAYDQRGYGTGHHGRINQIWCNNLHLPPVKLIDSQVSLD